MTVSESELRRLDARLAGAACLLLAYILAFVIESWTPDGPPVTHPLPLQVASMTAFLLAVVLLWYGLKWLILTEQSRLTTGGER